VETAAGGAAGDEPGAGDPTAAWNDVVARVKDRKLMVGVFLEESRRAGWEGNTLRVAADEVHRSLLEARENRELLGEILKAVYGRPITLRFVDKKEAPAAAAPPAVASSAAAREAPAAVAMEAPRVRVVRPPAPAELAPAPAPPPAPPREPVAEPEPAAALSPEVREAMLWFEGDIIRRPDPGGIAP